MVKNEEVISDDLEVANTLNNSFSNVVKNLKIPEKFVTVTSLKVYRGTQLKYKNHPSVIKRFSQRFSSFHFSHVDENTVVKEIEKLNLNKAVQDPDIPVKILK